MSAFWWSTTIRRTGRAPSQTISRVQVLHRTDRRGLGRSYIDGIAIAVRQPFDVIGQMDADLSHDPDHLPDLIAATERADVVIGSRYIAGGAIVNWPKRRRLLSPRDVPRRAG